MTPTDYDLDQLDDYDDLDEAYDYFYEEYYDHDVAGYDDRWYS